MEKIAETEDKALAALIKKEQLLPLQVVSKSRLVSFIYLLNFSCDLEA
jgi:hypothetical protein